MLILVVGLLRYQAGPQAMREAGRGVARRSGE